MATERRLLAEIQRPKMLFEELNTSKVKPASFYIRKARRRRTTGSAKKLKRDTSMSFCVSRDPNSIPMTESPSNRNSPWLKEKTEFPGDSPAKRRVAATHFRTSQEFMQDFYPDWLKSRQEFLEVYGKMREKSGLNVAEICKRISSHRTDDEREAVTRWLEHLECFRDLPKENLKELSGRFNTVVFEPGDALMRQGDPGDCMFVLFRGKVDVLISGVGKVGEIGGKNPVGEAAIKNNVARSATIVAATQVVALKLKKQDYADVLMTLKKAEKFKFTRFLQSVEFFNLWSPVKVQQFSSYLMSYNFSEGQTIYRLGDSSPTFYIITQGKVLLQTQVDVSQHHRWPVGDREWELLNFSHKFKVTVRTVNPGQFFGESEVIHDWPRQTSAVAIERTQCLIINRKELFEVLTSSDIEKILNFSPLSIPSDKALERQVLERLHSRKILNKALIDAADVDFSPSKRGVMTNKKSIKMQAWIDCIKERIKEEHEKFRSEIVESRKKTFR
eukprot:CAMPEP_0204911218 /NCGR_PEP_ID=MMETSP1397-20131031/9612_1 /ASSEMBLY_ACC=CAM_ASM_000891 /TAXON_ID=49980 /ORGANISM="Climacostomum Climacostomum virens, Strain Stock W-24" /LENGTH=501 /DNA_ID=CAMNT_0052081695 /DNA_START=577 /DNA_END=2079 /DNA_ORIENTATION=+